MKKIICSILAIFILAITPTTAYANSSRAILISPGLILDDNTAYCITTITANYSTDEIRAVIRLWHEGERIRMWYATGNGILVFERTYDISDYGIGTYELTVDYTINNEERPQISISRPYMGG